jgi:hypothetical protein
MRVGIEGQYSTLKLDGQHLHIKPYQKSFFIFMTSRPKIKQYQSRIYINFKHFWTLTGPQKSRYLCFKITT